MSSQKSPERRCLLLACVAVVAADETAKYGKCSVCSCPGFSGSGYTCSRNGCAHHYDLHW